MNTLNAYLDEYKNSETNKIDFGKMAQNLAEFDYVQSLRDEVNIPRSNYSAKSGLTDAVDY